MSAEWYNSELSSKRGVKGIVKKVSYLALVVTTMILDWMISQELQQINVNLHYSVFFAVLVAVMYKNVSGMTCRLTLIILPLSDVSCNKIAGAMRYIVEKIGGIAVQNNIDMPYFL